MSAAVAIDTENLPTEAKAVIEAASPAELRTRFAELRSRYIAESVHEDHAGIAAWYRLVFDLEDKGAVPDHYEAEAILRSAGLHLPLTKQLTRWTRLRHGDMLNPGTRPLKRVLPVVPVFFSWNDGQLYPPPPEVTADKNGRYVPPRHHPPSHVTFLNA
jgi:hypothetical protein